MNIKLIKENNCFRFVLDKISEAKTNLKLNKEFNMQDPNYFGEVSDNIANDLIILLNDLANDSSDNELDEKWISNKCLKVHFDDHCVGKDNNKKSKASDIRYDFTTINEYEDYENKINGEMLNPTFSINSLFNTTDVINALTNLFGGNCTVLFEIPCGVQNKYGKVKLGVKAYSSDVTTNFTSCNTVDIITISPTNNTISLYPVDAHDLEHQLNRLFSKYTNFKNLPKFKFNVD